MGGEGSGRRPGTESIVKNLLGFDQPADTDNAVVYLPNYSGIKDSVRKDNPSGWTPGSVVFVGDNGDFTQDNANLFWNDTNNRLGIGTAVPLAVAQFQSSDGNIKILDGTRGLVLTGNDNVSEIVLDANTNAILTLDKGATNNTGEIKFFTAGASGWSIGVADSDAAGAGNEFFIGRTTGGASPSIWIETDGKVGIGTTNPTNQLTLSGGAVIEMTNASDNTPTIALSGGVFVSGGGLWYKGYAGTYTNLAVS